jgi:hypothetical protein
MMVDQMIDHCRDAIGRRRQSIDQSSSDMTLFNFAPSLAWSVEQMRETRCHRIDRSMWFMRTGAPRLRAMFGRLVYTLSPRHEFAMMADHPVVRLTVRIWHRARLSAPLKRVPAQTNSPSCSSPRDAQLLDAASHAFCEKSRTKQEHTAGPARLMSSLTA